MAKIQTKIMVKIGDKVRFLNSVGGGKVARIQDKKIALVLDEDGFEIPILISELVVVPETNQYNFPVSDKKKTKIEIQEEEKEQEPELPDYTFNEREETEEGELLNIYFAYVPKDPKKIQTTDLELYLINDSNYYLNYQIIQGKKYCDILEANVIEPQTKLFIKTVEKVDLNDYEYMRLQAFAYKKRAFELKPVIDVSIKTQPTRFYKLHVYQDNLFFDEPALLMPLVENDVMQFATSSVKPQDLEKALKAKKHVDTPKRKRIVSKKQKHLPVVIDLHIDELVDTTAGMDNKAMLDLQLDTFHETMRQYMSKRGTKIVFIHGKGNGVLRKAIEKELRRKYAKCHVQDASFQEYGFGATQVTIH